MIPLVLLLGVAGEESEENEEEEEEVDLVDKNDTTSTRTLPGSWGHVQSKGRLSLDTGVRSCK